MLFLISSILLPGLYYSDSGVPGKCADWTQTAPGTAGRDLCDEARLPAGPALHAADDQQHRPRADGPAGSEQNRL